jgi:pimeloyl-ACP methyl ester carboxylesterase
MSTYVLVHGAWSGAQCFRLVRPMLQADGHQVFTPSLTGIGERVHLASAMVSLSTHVTDLVNHVLYEDHRDMVLLGFSYGGAVITDALRHLGTRVRELVYLDAFVPDDGQSVNDLRGALVDAATVLGAPWQIDPRPRAYDNPAEGDWQSARRVAQPAATFSQAVTLERPLEQGPFGRTYIKATADPQDADGTGPFWSAANRAKASDRWRYYEVSTNHMIPSNRPDELVTILRTLAV